MPTVRNITFEEWQGSPKPKKEKSVMPNSFVSRWYRADDDKLFCKNSSAQLHNIKVALLRRGLVEYVCGCCGSADWFGEEISLELHHKNGNNTDNRIENLVLLCPNCHSQETTKGKGIRKFSDNVFIEAVKESKNPTGVCRKLGYNMSGNSGGGDRIHEVRRRMAFLGLEFFNV